MQATVNSVLAWLPSSTPSVRGEGRPLRVSWVVGGYSPHPRQTWRLFGGDLEWHGTGSGQLWAGLQHCLHPPATYKEWGRKENLAAARTSPG